MNIGDGQKLVRISLCVGRSTNDKAEMDEEATSFESIADKWQCQMRPTAQDYRQASCVVSG